MYGMTNFCHFQVFYQVIRYDTRGMGKSSDPQQPYSNVDDLLGLLQYLGIQKAYFLETRGTIALELLQKRSDLADALLLVSVLINNYRSAEEALNAELPGILEVYTPIGEALKQNEISKAVNLLMQDPMFPLPSAQSAYQRAREIVTENIHLFLHPPTQPPVQPKLWSFPQPWLEQLSLPTLVLRGEQAPPKVGESFIRLAQAIPNAQQQVIAGSRSLPNMEQPDVFNQVVLQFLQTLG